jgi:hypothetical protein
MLRNLYSELLHTNLVTLGGVVVRKDGGNPSGQGATTIDNGIVLISCVVWSLRSMFGRERAFSLLRTRDFAFVTNGDDLMVSLSQSFSVEFSFERFASAMRQTNLQYTFTSPTDDFRETCYLSHHARLVDFGTTSMYLPVMDPARVAATCLYGKSSNAVNKHARYVAALTHAVFQPKLFEIIRSLVVDHYREVSQLGSYTHSSLVFQTPVPTLSRLLSLYAGFSVGSIDKIQNPQIEPRRQQAFEQVPHREPQSMSNTQQAQAQPGTLDETVPGASRDPTFAAAETIHAPGGAPVTSLPGLTTLAQRSSRPGRISRFDPIVAGLFSRASRVTIGERLIVATASQNQVYESLEKLKNLFGIDDEDEFARVLGRLLVYYGDNGTSPRNPHPHPFDWSGTEYTFADIEKLLIPTPRRFWRSLADETRDFLESHPGLMFNWADRHGFPEKHRIYGFDYADFCSGIPDEAREAVQAAKDAATSRAPYNIMRPDLKAVGSQAGTVIAQRVGQRFGVGALSQPNTGPLS